MFVRLTCILPLLCLYYSLLTAQDLSENNFTRYTRHDGLSDDNITSIVQDATGYIWAATSSGLNRYNGSQFVQFHNTNDSLSLPAESIKGQAWLGNSRLAVRTGVGLHVINTATGESRNIFIPYKHKKYQYKFNNIMAVRGCNNGDIIILTRPGIYHYDKDYRLVYRYDHYKDNEITSPLIFGIGLLQLDEHRFIITSYLGFYLYDVVQHRVKKMEPADCPLFAEFIPRSQSKVFQVKTGRFLILPEHSDSLIYLDIPTHKKIVSRLPLSLYKEQIIGERSRLVQVNDTLFYFTGQVSGFYKMIFNPATGNAHIFPGKYFPSFSCNSLLKDKDNCLWIGTNKGLFRQNNRRAQIQQAALPARTRTLFPNLVMDDVCGVGDKIYVACREDGGLLVFDRKDLRFMRRISFKSYSPTADNIYCLMAADRHSLLAGTAGALFRLDQQTGTVLQQWPLAEYEAADLQKDRQGNIWISAQHINKYEAATRNLCVISTADTPYSSIQRAQRLGMDTAGNIWMAGHGLCRYNQAQQRFDLLIDSFPFIKMPDRQVNNFVIDQQNTIWFNSNNNGLTGYNIHTGTFQHFTLGNGLPDNNIAAMTVVDNRLWMAGYSGISCLDIATSRIVSFGKEDGFPDLPVADGSKFFYDSATKQLTIGFSNILVRFDPESMLKKHTVPPFFIEHIAIGNQRSIAFPIKDLTTTWKSNDITVTVGSINFFYGNSQRFAYRLLKGDSTGWQQLGAQQTFSIANLAPGLHWVQVKLFAVNNRWPEQVKEITIQVLPPFWQNTWFITLLALATAFAVYAIFKRRTDVIRKEERQKTHIQRLKAEEYKTQVALEQISNYFSSSLTGKTDITAILWDVAQTLMSRMGYEDCMIYLWNDDKTKMLQKAAFGPKGTPEALADNVFDVVPGQGVVGYVMQTMQPLLIPDTRVDSRYRMDEMFRLSEICVPVIHNGELLGILDAEHPSPNHYKEKDLKILMTITTLLGNKIKQLESEQSLQVKQEELVSINEQLAAAQLSALQTQMNPHFIFNALNGIKKMILVHDAHNASRYLSKFAQMIRLTLSQSKVSFVTLRENIEYLESYLQMEKLRFDNSFTYSIQTDENLVEEEIAIPTLMIQPLVENAIWHGLMNIKGEKELRIIFSLNENTFTCTIADNGIGIREAEKLKQQHRPAHRSVGLDNLRNRIHIMNEKYHMDCTLEITDRSDNGGNCSGTLAVLCFKLTDL